MTTLFNIRLNRNNYSVFVVNNNQNKNKFFDEIKSLKGDLKRNIKICFDYEFNSKEIGLVQVMISEKNKSNNIYLVDPKQFNQDELMTVQQCLYLNSYPKILHGSESLDIPYIYNQVLNKDVNLIKQFTSTMTDTCFKCELIGNKKCSLYDALYQTKSINQKQYDFLQRLYKTNGTIYKIYWNTKKMKLHEYMYAAFDVIFLRRLNRILNKQLLQLNYDKNLINHYIRYTMFMRNEYISFKNVSKHSLTDEEEIELRDKIVGLKINYLRNPVLSLIKVYLKNNSFVENLLDEYKLQLIKNDFKNNL